MREIVFDTETTGTSPQSDRIIEIGGVELLDLIPTGRTFHCYVNPQREVSAGAVRVHGLTYEFLKKFPVFRRQIGRFLEFIEGARLVAHNARFDVGMFTAELDRLGMPPLANEIVDTLPLSRQVKKGGQHNLDALCRHYGVNTEHRKLHGALLDSEILAEVYLHLRGGRQRAMALQQVVIEEPEIVVTHTNRVYVARGSDAERDAHRAFVTGLKGAIWGQYGESDA